MKSDSCNMNLPSPKISVIIPVYNIEEHIEGCLNSLLTQSLPDWEAICIDDGSSDSSLKTLEKYARMDSRFRVYHHDNHGVGYTRNRGIDLALGDFLFFLDPDDWLHDENVFLDLYNAAIANNVSICGGTFQAVFPDKIIDQWKGKQSPYTFKEDGFVNYSDYQFDYGWVRFIYSRDFIVRNGLKIPELSFYEDPVFFVKVMDKAGSFYALRRIVYCYRTGYKSYDLSKGKVQDLLKGMIDIIILAKERGYEDLEKLEVSRLEKDYAEQITRQLKENGSDIIPLLDKINQLVYPTRDSRVEYGMYKTIIKKKEKKAKKRIDQIKKTLTWKIGSIVTYVPKMIKRFFARKRGSSDEL